MWPNDDFLSLVSCAIGLKKNLDINEFNMCQYGIFH
jgi:hypothetical protein